MRIRELAAWLCVFGVGLAWRRLHLEGLMAKGWRAFPMQGGLFLVLHPGESH